MPPFEGGYAEVMRSLRLGHALWQADPFDDYSKITLGCAGQLTGGKLTPLWQMWPDASCLEGQIRHIRIDAPKPLHSTNIKEIDLNVSVSNDPLPVTPSIGLGIGYQCTNTRAGLLSLKDGYAVSEELPRYRERELTNYLISQYEEILSSCNMELEELEELVVVTGTTMTGDWDAVYFESNSREGHVSVTAGLSQVLLQKTNLVVKHYRHQSPFLSSGHHHNPPRDRGACCEESKNQCIFMKSLRLRRRPLRKPQLIKLKAAAKPKEYDRDSDTSHDTDGVLSNCTDSIGSSSDEERLFVVKGDGDEVIQAPHVIDQAFDYIFSNCNAELAILHDRDIEKIGQILNDNSSPKQQIAMNEKFSVACLFHEENPAIDSAWHIVHSTTPTTYSDDEAGNPYRGFFHGTQKSPVSEQPSPSQMVCDTIGDQLTHDVVGYSHSLDSGDEHIKTISTESLIEQRSPLNRMKRPLPHGAAKQFTKPSESNSQTTPCNNEEMIKAPTTIHERRRCADTDWDPNHIFEVPAHPSLSDVLLQRRDGLNGDKIPPNGNNALAFGSAPLAKPMLLSTSRDDPSENDIFSHLHASPLYGVNNEEQMTVRDITGRDVSIPIERDLFPRPQTSAPSFPVPVTNQKSPGGSAVLHSSAQGSPPQTPSEVHVAVRRIQASQDPGIFDALPSYQRENGTSSPPFFIPMNQDSPQGHPRLSGFADSVFSSVTLPALPFAEVDMDDGEDGLVKLEATFQRHGNRNTLSSAMRSENRNTTKRLAAIRTCRNVYRDSKHPYSDITISQRARELKDRYIPEIDRDRARCNASGVKFKNIEEREGEMLFDLAALSWLQRDAYEALAKQNAELASKNAELVSKNALLSELISRSNLKSCELNSWP